MHSRRRRWIVQAITAVVAVQALLAAAYCGSRARRSVAAQVFAHDRLDGTEAAPDVHWRRADGSAARLADLRGRPVLVHFWASWCPPCRAELPTLLRLARRSDRPSGLAVLAIAVRDDEPSLRRFFSGSDLPPEVLWRHDSAAERFGASALPDTYLVSPAGRLVARFRGPRDWDTDAARARLRALLAGTE